MSLDVLSINGKLACCCEPTVVMVTPPLATNFTPRNRPSSSEPVALSDTAGTDDAAGVKVAPESAETTAPPFGPPDGLTTSSLAEYTTVTCLDMVSVWVPASRVTTSAANAVGAQAIPPLAGVNTVFVLPMTTEVWSARGVLPVVGMVMGVVQAAWAASGAGATPRAVTRQTAVAAARHRGNRDVKTHPRY